MAIVSLKPLAMSQTELLFFMSAIIAVIVVISTKYRKSKQLALPTGPPGHWLWGNDVSIPYAPRIYAKWTEQYGPLFSLRKGRTTFIIIGRQQAAIDIMEKQNAHLVDRPHNISAGEVLSGNKRILLVGAGDQFRRLRKAMQSQLSSKVVDMYKPVQIRAARNVVLDLLQRPDDHLIHARRYAASVIMTLAYGKTSPTSYSDPEVQAVNTCLARLGKALRPGAYMVDSYPILRYVPGYFKTLKQYHQEELALFRKQAEEVRQNMALGEASPSFTKYLVENQAKYELSDDELAYLAGSMFGAGSDTSAAAISIVVMAAATHPEAQKKVQEQLDAVVGRDRSPSFEDMEQLTEVQAFMQESYRWRPVSAGGFAHRATKDIEYGGYLIPRGATVIANHWALSRDPEHFPEPEEFIPSRWLNKSGFLKEDMKYYNFGFGRRVCPGQHVANRSVFINTAMILWAFNIKEDPAKPIDTLAFTDTANSHPLPFRAIFEPRIPLVKNILEKSD